MKAKTRAVKDLDAFIKSTKARLDDLAMIHNIEQELRQSGFVPTIEGDVERAFAQEKFNLFHALRAKAGLPAVEFDREEPVAEAPVDDPTNEPASSGKEQ